MIHETKIMKWRSVRQQTLGYRSGDGFCEFGMTNPGYFD